MPFAVIADLVDEVRTVSEESLSRALLLCLERAKLVVEPAGAAAVAAVLDDPTAFEPPVVAVLSGGNIDPVVLLRVIRHGLDRRRPLPRVCTCGCRTGPGTWPGCWPRLAAADANVLEVEHLRTDPGLAVDEVEIGVQLEMRGPEHCAEVLATLRAEGYGVSVEPF